MAKQFHLLFTLAIGLSPVIGYICSERKSSSPDAFEEYGCFCGTTTTSNNFPILYDTYMEAFQDCHESDKEDITIECAFKKDEGLDRTQLSKIPVVSNGSRVYENVTCL